MNHILINTVLNYATKSTRWAQHLGKLSMPQLPWLRSPMRILIQNVWHRIGEFLFYRLSSMTLLTRQGWGSLPTRDLWQKMEKDCGDGVSVFNTVLLCGWSRVASYHVFLLFPYGKCRDRPCSTIISQWPLPAWLSNRTGFPSCLGLLHLGPACQTQLISPAAAPLSLFFLHYISLMDVLYHHNQCFLSIDFP